MSDVNKFSKRLFDQWDFIIEQLQWQSTDTKVNFFPFERNDDYIIKILDLGFRYEECQNEKGYTIRIWK
jgi:hypothetical protein